MTIAALVLGVLVAMVAALVLAVDRSDVDPSMRFEGAFALGLGAIVYGGPLWFAQFVVTALAAVNGDGHWWLWLAWFGAPFAGALAGATVASARRAGRT